MIISQTPLRISLFGGGTDFPEFYLKEGGCVLTSAIDKYIYVIAKHRYDDLLRVSYTKTEMVSSVDELQHELIREALRLSNVARGVEIITLGDIPSEGSGLGSSSTVTVGTLHALAALGENKPTNEDLARNACSIERDILHKPIGVQDQYIAAYGGIQFIRFNQDGTNTLERMKVHPETLRTLNDKLLLFYTGTARKAEEILEEQKSNIYDHMSELRDLKHLTEAVYSDLLQGSILSFATFLHESWQIKKRLATAISNPDIDRIYEKALQAGALGGKICGAGGGGFLLLYVPYEKQAYLRKALYPLKELPFTLNAPGSKIIMNY